MGMPAPARSLPLPAGALLSHRYRRAARARGIYKVSSILKPSTPAARDSSAARTWAGYFLGPGSPINWAAAPSTTKPVAINWI